MALSPHEVRAERVREISDVKAERARDSLSFYDKVLLRRAEHVIDAHIRDCYQAGTYTCRVTVDTPLLTQAVRDALPKLYCGPKKWTRMEIGFQSEGGGQTGIFLEC